MLGGPISSKPAWRRRRPTDDDSQSEVSEISEYDDMDNLSFKNLINVPDDVIKLIKAADRAMRKLIEQAEDDMECAHNLKRAFDLLHTVTKRGRKRAMTRFPQLAAHLRVANPKRRKIREVANDDGNDDGDNDDNDDDDQHSNGEQEPGSNADEQPNPPDHEGPVSAPASPGGDGGAGGGDGNNDDADGTNYGDGNDAGGDGDVSPDDQIAPGSGMIDSESDDSDLDRPTYMDDFIQAMGYRCEGDPAEPLERIPGDTVIRKIDVARNYLSQGLIEGRRLGRALLKFGPEFFEKARTAGAMIRIAFECVLLKRVGMKFALDLELFPTAQSIYEYVERTLCIFFWL